LRLLRELDEGHKKKLLSFFGSAYRGSGDHYWSLTKLFCHATYIPMFLQIGLKNVEIGRFSELVYVDTHAGPGLAKIGRREDEVVLGSPLIALYWPRIVAERVGRFSKIARGFTKLFFIDKNPENTDILKGLIGGYAANVTVFTGDANQRLPYIARQIGRGALVYMFIDPFGSLETHLTFEALREFVERVQADIMMSVLAGFIARALGGSASERTRRARAARLFGGWLCSKEPECTKEARALCSGGEVKVKGVLDAYRCMLNRLGYRRVELISVRFEKGTIYHMMLATRGSGGWIDGYVEYLSKKAPLDRPKALRNLWLRAYGVQKPLDEFL